ncbi:RNA polymerase sigma factor [Romboutsia sp.]|uniref:RNA polymerase sigma factor n=1 Tax=Romboutsia sp. TaxID=1965302 RepID=UPI003F2A8B08
MEDYKIIDLFWERSQLAVEEINRKYGKLLKTIAINITNNNEDSKEIMNDTYLVAWNNMPDERPKNLSAYICKITRNLALKKYQYKSAKKRNFNIEVAFEELENCISSYGGIDEKLAYDEIGNIISNFLRKLTYEQRNIFLRRYWFLDSISDISNRFEISESKVKSSLYRSRKGLEKYLKNEGVIL